LGTGLAAPMARMLASVYDTGPAGGPGVGGFRGSRAPWNSSAGTTRPDRDPGRRVFRQRGPVPHLARRYGEDLAIIWIDSHPDIGIQSHERRRQRDRPGRSDHGGYDAQVPPSPDGQLPRPRTCRQATAEAELDRRQRLQPLHGSVRAAASGTCAGPAHGSVLLLQRRFQDRWRAQLLGRVRGGSATDLLLRSLPGAPVLTVNGAAELIGRSFPQTNEAIARLTEAGVLSQVTVGKRIAPSKPRKSSTRSPIWNGSSPALEVIPAVRSRAGRYHPGARTTY
jgi:hypothetical protein